VRVVIAEDLFLLRDGLTRMLQAHGLEIIAAVDNGADLLAAVIKDPPDVAIVDVRLPPTFTDEGIRAALAARREVPGLPVLVLSQYVEQLYARELLADQSGAVGYLLKDRVFNDDQFVDAVRTVAAGLPPSLGFPTTRTCITWELPAAESGKLRTPDKSGNPFSIASMSPPSARSRWRSRPTARPWRCCSSTSSST